MSIANEKNISQVGAEWRPKSLNNILDYAASLPLTRYRKDAYSMIRRFLAQHFAEAVLVARDDEERQRLMNLFCGIVKE